MNTELPPFPAHALAPLQRQMGEAVAEVLSIQPDIPYCCALSATSAACGRSLMTPSGPSRKIGANIYYLIAAPSGLGKSSVFRPCFEPLYSFQADRVSKFVELDKPQLLLEQTKLKKDLEIYKHSLGKKSFIAGQEDRMKDIIARLAEIELELRAPQVICEDITTEALGVVLQANLEQIFSLSADADKVFRNVEGRYAAGKELDESLYVKSYSRDPSWVNRISRDSIYLKSPCMTVCWLTQPSRMARLFGIPEFRDGGLLPRFLPMMRAPDVSEIPSDIPKINGKLQFAYHEMLTKLLYTFWDSETECMVPESPEVYQLLRVFYNSLVPRMNGRDYDIGSFLKRWTEQAWRIALCIHAAIHQADAVKHPISLSTAQGALEIANWHAHEQLRILEPVRESCVYEAFQKLAGFLQTQPQWESSARDIKRKFTWTAAELEKVLETFQQFFSRQIKPPPKRGRPPGESVRLTKTPPGFGPTS
jgi:hypothetical protein